MRLLLGQENILKRRGSTWEHSTRADSAKAAGIGSTARAEKLCPAGVFATFALSAAARGSHHL